MDDLTYEYYTDTLGRSLIPDEDTFNSYLLDVDLEYAKIENYIFDEKVEDAELKAGCLIIEALYKADKTNTADGKVVTSRSIEGWSQSYDISNAKSIESQIESIWGKFFYLDTGVD